MITLSITANWPRNSSKYVFCVILMHYPHMILSANVTLPQNTICASKMFPVDIVCLRMSNLLDPAFLHLLLILIRITKDRGGEGGELSQTTAEFRLFIVVVIIIVIAAMVLMKTANTIAKATRSRPRRPAAF